MMRSFSAKSRSPIDRFISEFDIALRAIAGGANYKRPIPSIDLNDKQALTSDINMS
jgi:hypothetical protein